MFIYFFTIALIPFFTLSKIIQAYEYYKTIKPSNNLDICKKKFNNEIHVKYHEFMGNYHKTLGK
jgi:hypothetical protein